MTSPLSVYPDTRYHQTTDCRGGQHVFRDAGTVAAVVFQSLYLLVALLLLPLWFFLGRKPRGSPRRPLRWFGYGLALFVTIVDYGIGLGFTVANRCYTVSTYLSEWITLVVISGWINSIAIVLIWGIALIPVTKALLSLTSSGASLARYGVLRHYIGIAVAAVVALVANALLSAQTSVVRPWAQRPGDVYQDLYVVGISFTVAWQAILGFLALSFGRLAVVPLWRSKTTLPVFSLLLTLCLLGWALDALVENAHYNLQDDNYKYRTPASIIVGSAFRGLFQTLALLFLLLIGRHPAIHDMPPTYEDSSVHQEPDTNSNVVSDTCDVAVVSQTAENAGKDPESEARSMKWEDEKEAASVEWENEKDAQPIKWQNDKSRKLDSTREV